MDAFKPLIGKVATGAITAVSPTPAAAVAAVASIASVVVIAIVVAGIALALFTRCPLARIIG